MTEPITCQIGEAIVDFSMTGRAGVKTGNRDPNTAPSGCYPCRGEDNWVTIAVCDDKQWETLVALIGSPIWARGDKYKTTKSRLEHQDELDRYIADWTRNRNKVKVMRLCQSGGVPAGAVWHVRELFTDEQNLYRGSFEMVRLPPSPDGPGDRPHLAPPWKLSKTASSTLRPPRVELGEDNDYVFRSLLRMTEDKLADLEARGVISKKPTTPPAAGGNLPIQFTLEENYKDVIGLR